MVDGRWWMENAGGEGDEKFMGKFQAGFGGAGDSGEI
jgi:hypothetical protein